MFVSQCPGWICYAEKSYPQSLPYISTTKSPQQILGTILRQLIRESGNNKEIYISSVQPCFDKKLEASRKVSFHCFLVIFFVLLMLMCCYFYFY